MSDKKLVESLKKVLADSYVLYLKTQNYHWNVTGPNFNSLHTMFEMQYNDLFAAVDLIAERIRALGEKAPGTFAIYGKLTSIKEGDENKSASQMVKELADDQKLIIKTLNDALDAANACGDDASADIMIGRLEVHQKNAWMLNSSL